MSKPVTDTTSETLTISELLERSAQTGIELQCDDGSFPQHETSYYDDRQLPVRATSQWLRIFVEAYSISGDTKYLHHANEAASYLISDAVRPHGYTFHCRNSSGKDKCNGVYGQAMPVWALTTAAEYLNRNELYDVAEDVAMCHPYDDYLSLWHRVEITGDVLTIDRTLNHQLAFAGAISTIDTKKCQRSVIDFLDNLESMLAPRSDGIIRHFARTPFIHKKSTNIRHKVAILRNRVLFEAYRYLPSARNKEISYQAANLFWLAYLKKQFPGHEFWDTEMVNRITEIVQTNKFHTDVKQTDMAFTASPTGFYIAVALGIFNEDYQNAARWITEQLNRTFKLDTESLIADVSDHVKMTSNICYLAEFSDMDLEVTVAK